MGKNKKLRHIEYYNLQEILDELYSKSKNGSSFKNLIEIMRSESNIKLAYRNIKRNGGKDTAGVDGLVMKDIAELTTEEVIERIQSMFSNYQPNTVRRVMIPKPNGKMRPLGIPCIWDRLFQQCILQILEPICEAKFHPHSYGFRPNRSTHHAIARMHHLINNNKLYHCVDIDIKGFFDNVNHGKLLKQLWTLGIRDKKLIKIISLILKAEIDKVGKPIKGTPQGGILSPLLSNIVLNELDWWISNQWETFKSHHDYAHVRKGKTGSLFADQSNKYRALRDSSNLKEIYIVRYADDFKILCRTRSQSLRIKIAVEKFLRNRLQLETSEEKSRIVNLKKTASEFLGVKIKAVRKGSTPKKIVEKKWYRKEDGRGSWKTTVLGFTKEPRFVTHSHMTQKAMESTRKKIKTAIKKVQKNPCAKTVQYFNSVVMGIQNYYKIATHISQNLGDIHFHCRRTLYNRLHSNWKEANFEDMSRQQKVRYKGTNQKLYKIQDNILVPISRQAHISPMNFNQEICNYTKKGRDIIHKKLKVVPKSIIDQISSQHLYGKSMEYTDNRISRYIAQHGKCAVTGYELGTHFHCHHIIPYKVSKDDSFTNLVVLLEDIHKVIHMKDKNKILKVLQMFEIKGKKLDKLNEFRKKVGNELILVK